jgi:hypothetical protein
MAGFITAVSRVARLAGGALATAALTIGVAAAHTTSLGYVPGTTAGSVTIWTGSYLHGGTVVNEGIATLTGVTVPYNQSVPFNIPPTQVRPVGLVNGVNNFFWGPAVNGVYPFPVSVDPVLFGGVVWWQGVTFTGLAAGTYTFTCGANCGTTQQWASLNGAGDTITITLTAGNIGGGGVATQDIPTLSEWGLVFATLMLAAAAFVTLRRRGR